MDNLNNNSKEDEINNNNNESKTEIMCCEETTTTTTNNIQTSEEDNEDIIQTNNNNNNNNNNISNAHLEINFFQTFLRMAVAMILTVWAISQSFFYINRRLAITTTTSNSSLSSEEELFFNIMEENNGEERKIKKKTKKRNYKRKEGENSSSSFSSSSSSRESSPEREKEENGSEKKPLKIDSNLLHTDTMPKITIKNLNDKKDEELSKSDIDTETPDSPPIQIETVGVLMERRKQSLESNGQQNKLNSPLPLQQFYMFKRDEEEEEEEEPIFRRLDSIVEEDSDELRSAQSSRASTAYTQRPILSPNELKEEKEKKGEENNNDQQQKMPSHFKFLFERQQSGGGSSQSSLANVVELSSSEEEEERDKGEKISSKVPRLDLEGVQLSEAEEEQTAREGRISTPISDTETILIIEEPSEEVKEVDNNSIVKYKVTFEDEKINKEEKEEKEGKENLNEENKIMFSPITTTTTEMFYQNPSDADRDQGEVFASLADQHIPMPLPIEDGRLSSPSMSINLDRSHESLDHSICSIPTQEVAENIPQELFSLSSPILSSSTLISGLGNKKDFNLIQTNNVDKDLLLTNGIESKKQSEKASSTSSSSPAYIRKPYEEEEEPMPLPPPSTNKTTNNLNSSSFPSSIRQEYSLPPPLPIFPPISSPESVLPLWGRNERLTSYLHGYRENLFKKNLISEKEEIQKRKKRLEEEGGGEEKENGLIKLPTKCWLENEKKIFEEKQKEEGNLWTVHPIQTITTKEFPTFKNIQKNEKQIEERNIPIKIHHNISSSSSSQPFSSNTTDWFNSYFPLNDSLWPYRSSIRGFQQSMSSELPPLYPSFGYSQQQQQQPSSLYGESSAKQSPTPFTSIGAFDRSFESSSRSDFMSASGGPPLISSDQRNGRQTTNIREIPIQRSASAFAPSIGGTIGVSNIKPTTTVVPPPSSHNEYYRREVLTRTLVTRSTEALSAPPPLSRSPPPTSVIAPLPPPLKPLDIDLPSRRDLPSEEYWIRYSRNIEEEERRLRSEQEHRRRLEEDRRIRVEEQRRRLEQQEQELVEKLRREREQLGKALEAQMIDRERTERDRIQQDRLDRESAERRRREEWDRIERERRAYEENELEKRRELERIERERLERERLEAEKLERERLERQKQELERIEKQRLEQERIERERLEIERIEIERIERIKREKREQEEREKERQKQEALRLQKVREELERAERERLELERQARELYEREQREEAERQREREREALKEAKRREEERLARERLERAEREAMEREIARRARERAEQERLEMLRKEKERIEQEQLEAEKRERERLEQERKEREMIEAAIQARERRDQERREERERERQRQEEERLEQERRQRERIEAQQRERDRQMQEQQERDRLAQLEAIAAERRAHRALEERQQRERLELERRAEELKEIEKLEQEKRERERTAEELRLSELREQEQRMAAERERERREAQEREERRQREGWRSREMLEQLARERDEKAAWEAEKRRLLEEHEIQERKRQGLTSKETLERLTRRPYYSRENLADYPDLTTKIERQVIERVDRTLWTDTTDPRPASRNGLTYYGGGHINPPPFYGTDLGSHPPHEGEDITGGGGGRESSRLYQPRADEQDWLRRGGSSRTSKYRQRMERARREFISGTPSGGEYPQPTSGFDPLLDRYQKSTEDLLYGRRPPSEYRGPLLQRFNSGEFSHPPEPTIGLASGLGRSPYELEDLHRSKSVLDAYSPTSRERFSRREFVEQESSHIRSKSADYLMDPRRPREEATIPENDLQKGLLGEHELRFRKSTERMQVPDWYRDYYYSQQQQQPPIGGGGGGYGPPSATTSGVFSAGTAPTISTGLPYTRPEPPLSSYYGKDSTRPWTQQQPPPPIYSSSPPLGGISFPAGMFDKYKNEIEDLRRSRGSLHQLGLGGEREGLQEHTKLSQQQPKILIEGNTITREYSKEAYSKTEVQTLKYPTGNHQPGYTVSTVPTEWRMAPKERQNSRVVEVVDTFVDRPSTDGQPLDKRYGGRITLEEVLDSIFQSTKYIPDIPPIDPSNLSQSYSQFKNVDGPGIFTPNQALMNKLADQPQMAEQLLKNEPIYVRCSNCLLIRILSEAKTHYCWCRHCYTYYCSRSCRQRDWEKHRDKCSFARINSLCKEVIMKVRRDPETQFHMSRVAREGFRREGRGSVNIRLISAYSAQLYLEKGWQIFARHDPNQLLFYYPIQALIDQRKEPSLIQLCKKYNPNEKFILSVSIIADVEQCPETPPPLEPTNNDKNKFREGSSPAFGQEFIYGTAVPTNV